MTIKLELKKRLDEAESFGEVFQVVKRAVREVLGLGRAGLELILMNLPKEVRAIHQIGSNAIVMNKKLLESLFASSKTRSEINAYIFSILLREYIRSLGVLDEEETRRLAIKVVKEALGEDHIAYRIISKGLPEEYQDLKGEIGREFDHNAEFVEDFDRENTQYIG